MVDGLVTLGRAHKRMNGFSSWHSCYNAAQVLYSKILGPDSFKAITVEFEMAKQLHKGLLGLKRVQAYKVRFYSASGLSMYSIFTTNSFTVALITGL